MNSPLFSVITVTLNCAEAACRTARSVREQDFSDFEYLVKDGDSSDGTVAKLKALGVTNVHVSKDTGIYAAMNQALALCRGRYIWFLNADDTFASPTVLSQFAEHLQRHGFPAFVYGDVQTLQPHPIWNGGAVEGPRWIQSPGKLSRFYLYRRTICHQAWAMERALYERCGGLDEQWRVAADYDLLLKALLRLRVAYSKVPCICVTYAGGGFSQLNFERDRLERQRLLGEHFAPWEQWVFGTVSRLARRVVHGGWFSRLQCHLPAQARARLAGL